MKIRLYFYCSILLTSLIFFPQIGNAQIGMDYELSADNENFEILDSLTVYGKSYQIISYQNGEVILVDTQGNLVLDSSTLSEVFKVKGFKDLFIQNGIATSKYVSIYSALSNIYSDSKSIDDLMTWIAIGATVVGIGSIAVGGIAIPIMVVVDSVKFVTSYITDNIQQPLNTADNLQASMYSLSEDSVSSSDYMSILSSSVQLRTELNDLNNHLIMEITGYGNIAYYEALYKIADALEIISSDNANKIRNKAFSIELSYRTLEATLTWLETLNTNSIINDADSITNNYLSLQNSRINSRLNYFENKLNNANTHILIAQGNITNYASQGADVSVPNLLITQANSKIDLAENHASHYEYRTALNYLAESNSLVQKATETASVSLLIHDAEIKVSEAQEIINQKASKGADVNLAQLKFNDATTAIQNSKSFLSTDLEAARESCNNAVSCADEAKLAAEMALEPQPSEENQPTSETEHNKDAGFQLPSITIYIIIGLIGLAIILGIIILIKKTKR